MIDYDKFQMSLKRLEEQYENYPTMDESPAHDNSGSNSGIGHPTI